MGGSRQPRHARAIWADCEGGRAHQSRPPSALHATRQRMPLQGTRKVHHLLHTSSSRVPSNAVE